MKKKRFLVFLAAGLLATGVVNAEALSDNEKSPHYSSGEIVVTAGRVEELKKEVTSSVTVITRKQIEESPAQDLGELLAERSIGHIQKYPGALTSVGIRGFRSDTHGNDLRGKILILIDGRRAGTGNLAKLMTDNVERIEIIRGPGAVQYGSAAIGGVVNVITRKGDGKPGGFIEQEIGSYGYGKTIAGVSGKIGGFDYSATGSLASMDDYKTGNDEKYFNNGYDDNVRGSVNLGYEFAPNNRIGVTYTHFEIDRAGDPSGIDANDRDNYKETRNRSLDVSYTGKTQDDRFSWVARYFVGEDTDTWYDPVSSNPGGWDDGLPSTTTTDQQGIQAQVSYAGTSFVLTSGVDWLDYDVAQTPYTPLNSSYGDTGYFVLAKAFLFDQDLVLSAGFRYDDYTLKYTYDASTPETSQDSDSFVKNFGMAYNLSDNVKLRASYAEGFRLPDAQSLAADNIVSSWSGSNHYVGNPDLDPESSYTVDGGIEVVVDGFVSSFSVFTTEYEDFIEQYEVASNEISWRNQDSATVTGVEGEFSYVFPVTFANTQFFLEPYVSGTYMIDYVSHFDDGSPDEDIRYLPEWNLVTGLKLHDNNGFSGMFNVAFFGDTFVQDWDFYPAMDVTKGSFCIANLSMAKKFPLGADAATSITIKGGVENMFDRDYEYVLGYPMPGRTFTMGIRMDI